MKPDPIGQGLPKNGSVVRAVSEFRVTNGRIRDFTHVARILSEKPRSLRGISTFRRVGLRAPQARGAAP